MARGPSRTVIDNTAEDSYGYVDNTVHKLQRLVARPPSDVNAMTFIVADYQSVGVTALAGSIQEVLGAHPIRSVPVRLLKGAAIAGDAAERLGLGNAPLTSFRLNNLVSDVVYGTSPLEALVGPLSHTTPHGMERTLASLHSCAPQPTRNGT